MLKKSSWRTAPSPDQLAEQRDCATLVKLLDFGISALADDESGASRSRTFSGSRTYSSPEQLDGRPTTPASDVYSLGLILYEMLTFTLPHDRQNPALSVAQTALNVLQVPIVPPMKVREDVPDRLDGLILGCLEHDPYMRPTVQQVATRVRAVKQVFEYEVLGHDDAFSTDVSGPPVEVLGRRLGDTSGDTGAPGPQRFAAAKPVDQEVFFANPVDARVADRAKTDPMPGTFPAQGPVTLPLAPPLVVPPPKPDSTLRLPTLQAQVSAPPSPPVVIPTWTPVVASPTTLGPASPRRAVRPAAMWTLLAACVVAMVTIAMATGLLPRRTAARGTASSAASASAR